MTPTTASTLASAKSGWQRFSAAVVQAYHAYATWLVSISWKRFLLLALLLMILASIVQKLPPFNWRYSETITDAAHVELPVPPAPPLPPLPPNAERKGIHIETPDKGDKRGVDISIDERGVRIRPRNRGASAPEAAASAAEPASGASDAVIPDIQIPEIKVPEVTIGLPPGADSEAVREAIEEAKEAVKDAMRDAEEARRDAEEARRDALEAIGKPYKRTRIVHYGDPLTDLALLWIIASAIIKFTYKGRMQAEVKAAQATEQAESESLKRQVVEARMAAMQAQVEPHFLFNTLASIDHLIETDPARASTMQKNLIALLRASMPTMREANATGTRDLGRELAVIRPYLEILKVRMEDRLQTAVDVPEGLHSAEFPPMMLQSLVENAIKHGLEPKPEGGTLTVKAEIVHGKLQVTVADTGLGFGKAATAGTGTGLANIRERLALLYGNKATLKITENQPSGCVVAIALPYTTKSDAETA